MSISVHWPVPLSTSVGGVKNSIENCSPLPPATHTFPWKTVHPCHDRLACMGAPEHHLALVALEFQHRTSSWTVARSFKPRQPPDKTRRPLGSQARQAPKSNSSPVGKEYHLGDNKHLSTHNKRILSDDEQLTYRHLVSKLGSHVVRHKQ